MAPRRDHPTASLCLVIIHVQGYAAPSSCNQRAATQNCPLYLAITPQTRRDAPSGPQSNVSNATAQSPLDAQPRSVRTTKSTESMIDDDHLDDKDESEHSQPVTECMWQKCGLQTESNEELVKVSSIHYLLFLALIPCYHSYIQSSINHF